MTFLYAEVVGGMAILVLRIDVGAQREKQSYARGAAPVGRFVQRRPSVGIGRVDVGTVVDQDLGAIGQLVRVGERMQRRRADIVSIGAQY